MTDEQFDKLVLVVEKQGQQLTNIVAILASSVIMGKVEKIPDAGAQATLEMLCDYFSQSAKGEPMKPIPRPDKLTSKKP